MPETQKKALSYGINVPWSTVRFCSQLDGVPQLGSEMDLMNTGRKQIGPNVIGRKPFGGIFVANSDAVATALTQAAIDEAHRAVWGLIAVL
jgi:hypothetical protein